MSRRGRSWFEGGLGHDVRLAEDGNRVPADPALEQVATTRRGMESARENGGTRGAHVSRSCS